MRWHHVLGLSFAAITLTWIFSGLMSMNPFDIFSASARPDISRYAGATPGQRHLQTAPGAILRALRQQGFRAVELEWKNLAGQPFVLARDAGDRTRVVTEEGGHLMIRSRWPQETLESAVVHLSDAPVAERAMLATYDSYYYRRDPEAMMGGSDRKLPVLRISLADPGATLLYVDVHTGQLELSLDRAQRTGRWLFGFLHSWDLPVMLAAGWLRDLVLIVLSLGGLALSVSGIVIAYRRLGKKAAQRQNGRA